MEATWPDKMVEKGRVEERIEGRLEEHRRSLLRQLEAKFGTVVEKVKLRVEAIDSSNELDTYLERILTADSFEEMGLA